MVLAEGASTRLSAFSFSDCAPGHPLHGLLNLRGLVNASALAEDKIRQPQK